MASKQCGKFYLCILQKSAEPLERDASVFLMISAHILSHNDYLHDWLLALIVCEQKQ